MKPRQRLADEEERPQLQRTPVQRRQRVAAATAPDAEDVGARTPPLHTRPIDLSSRPPFDNLVSPCSQHDRGAMHLPTSC